MSFIQREIDKLEAAIFVCEKSDTERYARLYAARQALSWVLDPTFARSPFNMINEVEGDTTNGLVYADLKKPVVCHEEYVALVESAKIEKN